MSPALLPLVPAEWPRARAVAADAGLAEEFEPIRDEAGIAAVLGDPFAYEPMCWLALDGGRPVGLSYGFLLPVEGGGHWCMTRIGVIEAARRRGVGTALLDQAKALRPDGFVLWVFQRNEGARRFYERHGFELVKLTDGAENMEREPDALYRWNGNV